MYKALMLFCTLLPCAVDFVQARRRLLMQQQRLDDDNNLIKAALALREADDCGIDKDELQSQMESILGNLDGKNDYPHAIRLLTIAQRELPKKKSSPQSISNGKQWEEDSEARECNDCKESFYLLNFFRRIRRKHHCRVCGEIFCSKCVSKQPQKDVEDAPVWMCEACKVKNTPPQKLAIVPSDRCQRCTEKKGWFNITWCNNCRLRMEKKEHLYCGE